MRTLQQNKSRHKWDQLIADKLNGAGFDVRIVLEKLAHTGVQWTPQMVKELMFRPIIQALTGQRSTARLTKEQHSLLIDEVIKFLGERLGVYVEYPCVETILDEQNAR